MADEKQLPDHVFAALEENNKILKALAEEKEKTATKEENVVAVPKVNSSLSSDEKARYANIGAELFRPVLSSLEKLIKKEKKRNEMLIKDDAETVNNAVKVQYETKPDPTKEGQGSSWLDTLLTVIVLGGIAIALFHDKIAEFFSSAWDWIKEMFSSIGNFFSFENGNNPIMKILSVIGSALSGLWDLVKAAFIKLAGLGKVIWEGIKTGWDKFITGPDGILNFGVKIVKGIVDFAKGAISWIGDAIKSAVMGPIKMIFGGAEDEGKEAGKEAANDVEVSVSQAAADQAARQQALTDDVLYNAEKADQAIQETAEAQRKAAQEQARAAGLTLNDQGRIDNEAIKMKVAEESLRSFMKSQGANFDNLNAEQQKAAQELMAKHTVINDNGTATINGKALAEELSKMKSDGIFKDSAEVNLLQGLSSQVEHVNAIQAAAQGNLAKYMQMNADMQAADNLENMTEEERFEARYRQAMAQGKAADFRFMEGRKMILSSAEIIKSAFTNYDNVVKDAFTSTWRSFMIDFVEKLKIEIETVSPQDNSKNTYHITPLHRESFAAMTNGLLKFSRLTAETIIQQNKILDKIKTLLEEPPEQKIIVSSPAEEAVKDAVEEGVNYVAQRARDLKNELFSAVSSWA